MKRSTRRVFLHKAATLAAGLACAHELPTLARAASAISRPRAFVTGGDRRFVPVAVED